MVRAVWGACDGRGASAEAHSPSGKRGAVRGSVRRSRSRPHVRSWWTRVHCGIHTR